MVGILGANTLSSGYDIDNSLRFNDGDSPVVSDTPSSDGDKKTWTWSGWLKRSTLGAEQTFFGAYTDANNYVAIQFDADDTLNITHKHLNASGGSLSTQTKRKITNRVFRDTSAWYSIVVKFDAANTNCDIYVNGTEETSFSVNEEPENLDYAVNNDVVHYIGTFQNSVTGVGVTYFDGYMADVYLIDGAAKAASDFGETNDNGVWVPTAYSGSYGTNGFFLEFQQTGTSANASGIGADTSGNDRHFAVSNLAAIDVCTDTPTNNFATINSLANQFNPATLSEGNTRVDFDNGTSTVYNISTIGVTSGKWYCEVKAVTIPDYGEIGIASRPCKDDGNDDKLTKNQYNYGYTANNGNVKSNNTAGSSYGDSFDDDDIIGIALDLDNNKLYFSKNSTWQNSGDPESASTGTGATSIQAASGTLDGVYYFAGGDNRNGHDTRMDFNFGNPAYANSSGNADANGYGDFEYAPPSGYYALCTKNLAEFG